MTVRTIATLHLPLEAGAAARIAKAVAREFPDAVVGRSPSGSLWRFDADDDVALTVADRRRIARQRASRASSPAEDLER